MIHAEWLRDDGSAYMTSISREAFDRMTAALIQRTLAVSERVLDDAGLNPVR